MELYKNQVKLLLDVIPMVSNETIFALFGGTAINLFVRNMPRLSVDIDLAYVPIEDDFDAGRINIENGLNRIKNAVEKSIPRVSISRQKDKRNGDIKLNIQTPNATIKVEVNPTGRGLIGLSNKLALCEKTQEEFDVFCAINVVPLGQLYGGKICAALDRQHPRDLFDVKYLLENEGFTDEIKRGFIYSLLCSGRPIHEVIDPNLKDQRQTMRDHFDGMTTEVFTYENYEEIRNKLISIIKVNLTEEDKDFIVQFDAGEPNWNHYNFSMMPGVKWKLKNLTENLIPKDPEKHKLQHEELIRKLYS